MLILLDNLKYKCMQSCFTLPQFYCPAVLITKQFLKLSLGYHELFIGKSSTFAWIQCFEEGQRMALLVSKMHLKNRDSKFSALDLNLQPGKKIRITFQLEKSYSKMPLVTHFLILPYLLDYFMKSY